MVESAAATIASLDAMISRLRRLEQMATTDLTMAAADALESRKQNFHSTSLRLQSVEKRVLNVIQLILLIVPQMDTAILRADSRAMKLIAILTVVFLPVTSIASIFDTPFFDNDYSSLAAQLKVTSDFWIFWAVSVPLTVCVWILFVVWYYYRPTFSLSEDHVLRVYWLDFRDYVLLSLGWIGTERDTADTAERRNV